MRDQCAESAAGSPKRLWLWVHGAYAAVIGYVAILAFRAHFDLSGSRFNTAHAIICAIAFFLACGGAWIQRRHVDHRRALEARLREEKDDAERRKQERWNQRFPNGLPSAKG